MYGLNPSGSVLALPYEIKPALSLVSELVHVKQLEAGQDIGYGATYTTEEPQWDRDDSYRLCGWLDPRDAKLSCAD